MQQQHGAGDGASEPRHEEAVVEAEVARLLRLMLLLLLQMMMLTSVASAKAQADDEAAGDSENGKDK